MLSSWSGVLLHLGATLDNAAAQCRVLFQRFIPLSAFRGDFSSMEGYAFYFWCHFRRYVMECKKLANDLSIDASEPLAQPERLIRNLGILFTENVDPFSSYPSHCVGPKTEFLEKAILFGQAFCVTKEKGFVMPWTLKCSVSPKMGSQLD
jgi:hypothetical protein